MTLLFLFGYRTEVELWGHFWVMGTFKSYLIFKKMVLALTGGKDVKNFGRQCYCLGTSTNEPPGGIPTTCIFYYYRP